MSDSIKEYDIFRDSFWRYLGYTNEVGEAFRPLVSRFLVNSSYAVATTYVCADVADKVYKEHKRNAELLEISKKAGDVFIWQMLASVFIPGFTINRITWLTSRLLKETKLRKEVVKITPTIVGLCSIPFIIKPIDSLVDLLMDETYRKMT